MREQTQTHKTQRQVQAKTDRETARQSETEREGARVGGWKDGRGYACTWWSHDPAQSSVCVCVCVCKMHFPLPDTHTSLQVYYHSTVSVTKGAPVPPRIMLTNSQETRDPIRC